MERPRKSHTPERHRAYAERQNRPFTHEDILAHIKGEATHNELAKEEVRVLLERFKEMADRRSDGDTKQNALVFGGIIREINERLNRKG